jgi:formate-dependent nitrite reductase cytochrome c552 subunit
LIDLPKSAAEAREVGAKFYFTGRPCKHGHVAERHTRGSVCVDCRQRQRRDYRTKNPEAVAQCARNNRAKNAAAIKRKKREYNVKNAEAIQQRKHEYYLANAETIKQRVREWEKSHPDVIARRGARTRAARLARRPHWLSREHEQQIQALYAEAQRLGEIAGEPYHVDHIVPLQGKTVSGLHVPWNLQVIPGRENWAKSNRF